MPKTSAASKTRNTTTRASQPPGARNGATSEIPVTDGSLDGAIETEASEPTFRLLLSHDDIAVRAYHLGEARRAASQEGDELGDWLQAERELLKERD